jgi:hypothetical protein
MTHLRPALHCMMTSRTAVKLAQTDVDAAQALSVSGAMNPMPPERRAERTTANVLEQYFMHLYRVDNHVATAGCCM